MDFYRVAYLLDYCNQTVSKHCYIDLNPNWIFWCTSNFLHFQVFFSNLKQLWKAFYKLLKVISILSENTIVPVLICSGKWWFWYIFTQNQMIRFRVMSFKSDYQISQAFTVRQLSKHHSKQLIPTFKMLNVSISLILIFDASKLIFVQKWNQLGKYVFLFIHCSLFIWLQN